MTGTLATEVTEDGFAVIRMINGENRLRLSTIDDWNSVLDRILSNENVKAIFTTGEGKFFSNGIDLEWLTKQETEIQSKYLRNLNQLLLRLMTLPVPSVALINGHAFGAGAFIALSHDYRVMRPDKGWINWPETVLGMRFQGIMIDILRAKIPAGIQQREALIFAKRLPAKQAQQLELVDVVTDESNFISEGKRLAKSALGKNGLGRGILETMKRDLYLRAIPEANL